MGVRFGDRAGWRGSPSHPRGKGFLVGRPWSGTRGHSSPTLPRRRLDSYKSVQQGGVKALGWGGILAWAKTMGNAHSSFRAGV